MSDFMRTLCKIAIPVTLQGMLQASFSIVDQVMIGQLGEAGMPCSTQRKRSGWSCPL